ncbi:MAG TPA: DUF885 domain-containing protein [Stenotrophomonas sp.]
MFKRMLLAAVVSLSLAVPAAHATAATDTAGPAWIARSNENAKILLDVISRFRPEDASDFGLADHDADVADLKPRFDERLEQALAEARSTLQGRLAEEKDPNVRQDLAILLWQIDLQAEGLMLDRQYLLPYVDVGQLVFNGEFLLLKDEIDPQRRPAALDRLKCYAGQAPGCASIVALAKARTLDKLGDASLLWPYRGEVEQRLAQTGEYIDGLRELYAKHGVEAAKAPLDLLEAQMKAYDAWVRETILPRARTDFRLPAPVYAHRMKQYGLDVDPQVLMKQAMLEFAQTRAAMQMLAPVVAKAEGFPAGDYRDVLKRLKARQLDADSVLPTYRRVIADTEAAIRAHRIVTLPQRDMLVRIASDAESAAISAPHMDPPPLIDNHGERGSFVLATGRPGSDGGAGQAYDDFTYEAAAWTMTAHEGRPGHELQFAGMIERGVSLTRALFAFNSVNAEGWGLYSEMEMLPYEPPAGQFVALQFRLLRAARAFLDPMLNLGLITPERVREVLIREGGFSEALAQQEIERYTFQSPGQAAAYFYGYTRILQLRMETEVALGERFDRLAFNDFLIAQGMLPPDLIAEAVHDGFVPAHAQRAAAR